MHASTFVLIDIDFRLVQLGDNSMAQANDRLELICADLCKDNSSLCAYAITRPSNVANLSPQQIHSCATSSEEQC